MTYHNTKTNPLPLNSYKYFINVEKCKTKIPSKVGWFHEGPQEFYQGDKFFRGGGGGGPKSTQNYQKATQTTENNLKILNPGGSAPPFFGHALLVC